MRSPIHRKCAERSYSSGLPVVVLCQTQHRALVVEHQRLVAGVDLGRLQVRVGDPARLHESQAAVDLGAIAS